MKPGRPQKILTPRRPRPTCIFPKCVSSSQSSFFACRDVVTAVGASQLRFDAVGGSTAITFEQASGDSTGVLAIGGGSTCTKLDGSTECILTTISNLLTQSAAATTYLKVTDAATAYATPVSVSSAITAAIAALPAPAGTTIGGELVSAMHARGSLLITRHRVAGCTGSFGSKTKCGGYTCRINSCTYMRGPFSPNLWGTGHIVVTSTETHRGRTYQNQACACTTGTLRKTGSTLPRSTDQFGFCGGYACGSYTEQYICVST